MIVIVSIIFIIIFFYMIIRMSLIERFISNDRFIRRISYYEDIKTGEHCNRFEDSHGYYFYCPENCSYYKGAENAILSERTYSENVRWKKAKDCNADYFKSTTKIIDGLTENGYDYKYTTFIRETNSGQLYCITRTKDYHNNINNIKYYKIPIIEVGEIGSAGCKLFLNHAKKKEIYNGLYERYMRCNPLDYGKEYGNHDLSFREDKNNNRFKHSWLWK